MAMNDILGKIVCLTGNDEVGYGAENKPVFGRVISVEKAHNLSVYPLGFDGNEHSATFKLNATTATALGETEALVVGVEMGVFAEGVGISATSSKQPAVGDGVAADGAGGVVKLGTDAAYHGAVCTAVDTGAKKATIRIM